MRQLLFAGAVAVARADDQISEEEIHAFEEFFGEDSFHSALNIDKLEQGLPGRIERTRQTISVSRRMQVLRDLCLIARSDGHTSDKELATLQRIADGLQIARDFLTQQLRADFEPD